jgi:hypothetical protein
MIRDHLFSKRAPADPDFRWRGEEVSRVEGLSDGVFALTITLLVVSATAPRSFYDLWVMVRDLPAFVLSLAIIMMAWHTHYVYFRRYGLEDIQTIILNSIFLFLIMFFAYPLKFLCTFLWSLVIGSDPQALFAIPDVVQGLTFFGNDIFGSALAQRVAMMNLYGFGLFGVYATLFLMHYRAYRLRHVLELDGLEIVMTQGALFKHALTTTIAAASLLVLLLTSNPGVSGVVYFLLPVLHAYLSWVARARRRKAKRLLIESD